MKAMVILILVFVFIGTGASSDGSERPPPFKMTEVKVLAQTKTSARIIVSVSGEVSFHVFRVSDPERLVIEIVDTVHNWTKKDLNINGDIVKRIRSAQFRDYPLKIVRVVCDMAVDDFTYEEQCSDNQIQVSLVMGDKNQPENNDYNSQEDKKAPVSLISKDLGK